MHDFGAFVQTFGLPLGMLAFVVWGTYIKDPPLFVSWREHRAAVDRGDKAVDLASRLTDQNGQMVQLMKGK